MSTELDRLILTRDVAARGDSRYDLDRRVRRGELIRVRRGAYVAAEIWRELAADARHRLIVHATRWAARDEPVFCRESAAALHGIPLIGDWPTRPHVTDGRAPSNSAVARSRRPVRPESIVAHESGARVTDPVTTVLDLAASRSLLGGIIAVSHLRRGTGMSRASLESALVDSGIHFGARRARAAIARSTDAADSPLETLILVRCEDLGFEAPEQQAPVVGVDGRHYRVDFAWGAGRILAEADGRVKYRDPALLAGRTPDEVVWAEKQRENAIRPLGDRFLRLTWADAWDGAALERLLERAGVARVARRRPLTR